MKVPQVTVDVLQVPVAQPYVAAGRAVEANWHVLARITTADGVQGLGYIVYPRPDLMGVIAQAARELGEHLLGSNVLEVEAAWERLARRGDWAGPGGLLHCALAPLDIALWDAIGKTLGQPVARLFGSYRDRLPAYASDALWYSLSLDDLAASATRHVAHGLCAVKLRLGKEPAPEAEAQRVRVVRQAVGEEVRIMVDATESWSLAQARRTGQILQAAGITWLEDPVHHQDVAGLAHLVSALQVPIAAGEHLYHLAAFRELLQARAVDIVILDLARVGGITPWRKMGFFAYPPEKVYSRHYMPGASAERSI